MRRHENDRAEIATGDLPQRHAALLLNTFQRADGEIRFGVRNGDGSGFHVVPKLYVAAFLSNFPPAVGLDQFYDLAAPMRYTEAVGQWTILGDAN